jgi:hypothetical protein
LEVRAEDSDDVSFGEILDADGPERMISFTRISASSNEVTGMIYSRLFSDSLFTITVGERLAHLNNSFPEYSCNFIILSNLDFDDLLGFLS